jgi:glycosyltransferase involved in cell wall biosynthesis
MALVSVIMPLYNGEPYVEAALRSVGAQGIEGVQVIVVNDGSTDGSGLRVERSGQPATLLHQENLGPASARNHGVRFATGEFLAFIDADDVWPEGRLKWQIDMLRSRPDLDIVQGQLRELHLEEGRWIPRGKPLFAHHLGTALYRRDVFERVGPLDESLPYCEDVDWFFSASEAGVGLLRHEEVCMSHRRHDNNLTNRRDLVRKYTLKVVAKHRRKHRGDSR